MPIPSEEAQETPSKCVLTIITDGIGHMIFVKRHDGPWSVCAGHIEGDEDPEDAARREILEETGLTPEHITRIYESKNPNMTCYSAQCQGTPHGRNDPDNEGEPQWVDVRNGIPENVWDKLAGPEDETNVVRQLFQKEYKLQKSNQTWLEAGFMDLAKAETFEEVQHGRPDSFVGYHWAPSAEHAKGLVAGHSSGIMDDTKGLFVSDNAHSWASPWMKGSRAPSLVHGSVNIKNPYILKDRGIEQLRPHEIAKIKAKGHDSIVNLPAPNGLSWNRQALLFQPSKQIEKLTLSGKSVEDAANLEHMRLRTSK
jgi:8-oxo-dGTP pyrophosphatase MutT (NUDIX family)